MYRKTILFVLYFIFLAITTKAQGFVSDVSKRGTSAAPFLAIGQGARAISLGSAFVGLSDDESAIYWNPAGLAKLPGAGIMFDHTTWIANISYNFVAAHYQVPGFGTLGFGITTSNIGDMKVTTIEEPEGTGEIFSATNTAFSIAYSLNLTDNFSIGFNPKYVMEKVWKMSASAFAMDLGIQYRTPFDGVILAMSFSNFGTKMQLSGNSTTVLYDPDPQTSGNNGKIPANITTNEWSLPLIYRVGVCYAKDINEDNQVRMMVDALHPSDNYESVNCGLEYTMFNSISLRGGYKSLFLKDSEESYTMGFGLKKYMLGNVQVILDYAYQKFGRFKDIQKFSVSMTF